MSRPMNSPNAQNYPFGTSTDPDELRRQFYGPLAGIDWKDGGKSAIEYGQKRYAEQQKSRAKADRLRIVVEEMPDDAEPGECEPDECESPATAKPACEPIAPAALAALRREIDADFILPRLADGQTAQEVRDAWRADAQRTADSCGRKFDAAVADFKHGGLSGVDAVKAAARKLPKTCAARNAALQRLAAIRRQ